MKLPKPSCELGYTLDQLEEILGNRYDEFLQWMYGQTIAICQGRKYNYDKKQYEATNCGPHGWAYYPWDLQRFLDGKPVVD